MVVVVIVVEVVVIVVEVVVAVAVAVVVEVAVAVAVAVAFEVAVVVISTIYGIKCRQVLALPWVTRRNDTCPGPDSFRRRRRTAPTPEPPN